MGRNRPGSRVDIASARTGDCVGRDSWSNAQLLGSRVTSAGAAGRPAAPRTRDRLARDRWWTRVTSNLGRVGRDSWSITSQLGAGTESPGTAGQPCVSSGPGLSRPGWLVDPTAPRTQVRGGGDRVATPRKRGPGTKWAGISGRPCGSADSDRVGRDSWSTPKFLGPGSEMPGAAGRPRVSSDPGPSGPVELVTVFQMGPGTESTGIAGRPQSSSDIGPIQLGHLVDPESARNRDVVGRDSLSAPQHIASLSESAGTASEPRVSSDPGLSWLG